LLSVLTPRSLPRRCSSSSVGFISTPGMKS
jgi:hypothetical protein